MPKKKICLFLDKRSVEYERESEGKEINRAQRKKNLNYFSRTAWELRQLISGCEMN